MKIFRAEAELGHDATALNAIEPLLRGSYSQVTASAGEDENQPGNFENLPAVSDVSTGDGVGGAAGDGQQSWTNPELANLEQMAPLPAKGVNDDAGKLVLSMQIAQVYEHSGKPANALPYLKLAAWMQSDAAARAELQKRIERIQTALTLEARNAQRMPEIRVALDQSNVVRPTLTTAEELMREQVQP